MLVLRQTFANRVIHWGVALSTFGLIITGIFQMPVAKRYNVDDIPGMAFAGDYWTTLNLHYLFAIVLIVCCVWHLVYHAVRGEFDIVPRKGDVVKSAKVIWAMASGGQEPASAKYLPEQRLAWLGFVLVLALLIVTGLIKTYKNILGFDIPSDFYFTCAMLHNLGMGLVMVLIGAHLLAFVPKINRFLLPAMFSGQVDADYVLHRHSDWKEGVLAAEKEKVKKKVDR